MTYRDSLLRLEQALSNRTPTDRLVPLFQKTMLRYYSEHRRDLPWRRTDNPYDIYISEVMLQQTQVERVVKKYSRFINRFPDFRSLADSPFQAILSEWRGLGYNRRCLALKRASEMIVQEYGGKVPDSVDALAQLPGIGRATASAIITFSFNRPTVFIETNIRRVFIHFFFRKQGTIADQEILPLVKKTLVPTQPRIWYYSLMDYGAMLKSISKNPNIKSKHYKRQPRFQGSTRQIRGLILKTLLEARPLSEQQIIQSVKKDPDRVREAIERLEYEGFIHKEKPGYTIVE